MAEEKKVSDQKPNVFVRIGRWFKNLPGRIAKSFKNMAAELRLVSWPSKKKWIACSVTVLVFVLVMSIVIGALDMGATALVKLNGSWICPAAFPNQRCPFSPPPCRTCRVGYSVKSPVVCLPFRPFPTV